jgi:hypothetical protein
MEQISSLSMLMMLIYWVKTNSIKKNMEALLEASREVGLEKTKNMVMFHHQNIGENPSLLIANKSFKNVAKFK